MEAEAWIRGGNVKVQSLDDLLCGIRQPLLRQGMRYKFSRDKLNIFLSLWSPSLLYLSDGFGGGHVFGSNNMTCLRADFVINLSSCCLTPEYSSDQLGIISNARA